MLKPGKLTTDKQKSVKLPQFIVQGTNILNDICEILLEQNIYFQWVFFLCDKKTFTIGGRKVIESLKNKNISVVKKFIGKSDTETVKAIAHFTKKKKFDLLIGFGGGKILDVAKLSAGMNRIKFISIPTILSNDGIASPVSVITDKNGIPVSHLTSPAYGIIIDFNIIKRAPVKHLRAGVGDLISNLSAVFDCRLAEKNKKEKIDPEVLKLAETGAKRLLRLKTADIKNQKFLELLCDGLIKSGLAMSLVGSSRPASGSEHKISHSIDHLFPGRAALHGEQVGIATLFTMILQHNKYLRSVVKLYRRINFPVRISYLKIGPEQFVQAILEAKKIRPWRYTILEHKSLTEKSIRNVIGMIEKLCGK